MKLFLFIKTKDISTVIDMTPLILSYKTYLLTVHNDITKCQLDIVAICCSSV
jgi:hypothetical protein